MIFFDCPKTQHKFGLEQMILVDEHNTMTSVHCRAFRVVALCDANETITGSVPLQLATDAAV